MNITRSVYWGLFIGLLILAPVACTWMYKDIAYPVPDCVCNSEPIKLGNVEVKGQTGDLVFEDCENFYFLERMQ